MGNLVVPFTRCCALFVLHCFALAFWPVGCVAPGHETGDQPRQPPKLVFSETSHDFGTVPQGTLVSHEFLFANEGGTELSIASLRSACDCTATLSGDQDIPPGGRGAIRAAFETDAVFGAQRRTVTVYSNDPAQRIIMLTLTGDVELDVVADPLQVYVGAVPRGTRVSREVALLTGNENVRIESVATDGRQLTVRLVEPTDGAMGKAFAIEIPADAQLGPFTQVVRVRTSSIRHPLLEVPVTGVVAEK